MYLAPTEPGDTATADAVERVVRNNGHAQDGDAAEVERRRLTSELSLVEGGRYYHYCYHDERLTDAVAYAQLLQSRASPKADTYSRVRFDDIESPDASDRQLMTALDISFENGRYEFEGFHYDHLADAAGYARNRRRSRKETL
jgi:hypothetical protein